LVVAVVAAVGRNSASAEEVEEVHLDFRRDLFASESAVHWAL